MSMPRGLQKPHHFVALIFPLAAFVVVGWASISFWGLIAQTNGL